MTPGTPDTRTSYTPPEWRRLYTERLRTGHRINSVSVGAHFLFFQVHSICDDYGRFPADPGRLFDDAMPLRAVKGDDDVSPDHIARWLDELGSVLNRAGDPLVRFYDGPDGQRYGQVVGFCELQPKGMGVRARREGFPGPSGCVGSAQQQSQTTTEAPASVDNGGPPLTSVDLCRPLLPETEAETEAEETSSSPIAREVSEALRSAGVRNADRIAEACSVPGVSPEAVRWCHSKAKESGRPVQQLPGLVLRMVIDGDWREPLKMAAAARRREAEEERRQREEREDQLRNRPSPEERAELIERGRQAMAGGTG